MAGLTDSYSRLDEIDPELFRQLILGNGSTETTSDEEANGIMSRYEPVGIEPAEPEQGFLSSVVNWMRGNTDDPERLADAIVPQTIDLGPDLSNWEAMPELKTIILPPPPPVSVTPIAPGSTNLALYGDRLGKGTITSSTPASYTDAPADTLMTRPDGTPRSTQELEQLAFDALPNIQVDAEAGLMTRPVQETVSEVDVATYSVVSGDTLSKIAKANNTTVAELTAANPEIKDINKISVGQEIKLPTVPPVSDTTEAGTTESDRSGLLDFIGAGEGGYDSANRGTIGGNVIGSQMVASRGGKKVSELTVAEIKKYQSITDPNNKDRLFTVGKYQAIPDTFNQAVKGLGLPDDTVFTPEVQEKVGLYLVSEKRPKVGMFLRGEGDVTTNTAMLELAKEFASIPVPFSIPKGKYGKWPKTDLVAGDSFYKNPKASKGNRAGHTVAETRAVLEAAKR